MKELYAVLTTYMPSNAPTNHFIAYAKGFAEHGIHVKLFFLRPSINRDKFEGCIDNIDFIYLWDNNTSKNERWNYILNVKKFYNMMVPEIPVLVSGSPDIIFFLRLKKGVKLYHERTENPYMIKDKLNKLYIRTLHKLDGVIVITPSLRDLFIEEFNVRPEKIIVANMVVDESRFEHIEVPSVSHTISYCGTISEWKDGVSYLVRAFVTVYKKHPEYKLVLMGKFENEETKNTIMKIINDNHVQNSVIFTGVVKNEEMPSRLKSSEILALSRPKQKEKAFGFATKIGEYLMTERPVVMTDVGDVSYYLKNLDSAVLAKPNDEVDFADKLLWVIEHPKESLEIGKRGKEVALAEFNYLIESKKVIDFIFS